MRMSLLSIRVGRGHSREAEDLTAEYLGRVRSPFSAEARVFRSEALLLEAVAAERRSGAAEVWLADSRGQTFSSEQFANTIRKLQEAGKRTLLLAIGPADGWSETSRESLAKQGRLVSLGTMTLPHELARIVFAEQLYRATTILAGHPYHLGHD